MTGAEAQANWRARNPNKARANVRRSNYKKRFGGNREAVLERDGYACTGCGMTDKEHREKFGRAITVDHIDGHGRYSEVKNHSIDNLTTLCLPCHGRKDVMQLRYGRRKVMEIPVYQIDNSVPIPAGKGHIPLASFEVGDSVLFPIAKRKGIQSYASQLKKRTGKEFTIRKMDNETCRIWRTK